MPVEQDLALLVQELESVEPTPGKSFKVASFGSGQAFDQSERTNTTEPSGMRPCFFSQASISAT
jgi:hypothetical protein